MSDKANNEEHYYNNMVNLSYDNGIINLNNSAPNLNVGNILENTLNISNIHHSSEEISISETLRSFALKSSETSGNSNNINYINSSEMCNDSKSHKSNDSKSNKSNDSKSNKSNDSKSHKSNDSKSHKSNDSKSNMINKINKKPLIMKKKKTTIH